jgi:hypothetical protein
MLRKFALVAAIVAAFSFWTNLPTLRQMMLLAHRNMA